MMSLSRLLNYLLFFAWLAESVLPILKQRTAGYTLQVAIAVGPVLLTTGRMVLPVSRYTGMGLPSEGAP